MKMPDVNPGDWVQIGRKKEVNAVISTVYERLSANEGNIEVVYFDRINRAINEDLIWTGSNWEFAKKGLGGCYANRYPRLALFVSILRRGRH
jgi:hypothetical protein